MGPFEVVLVSGLFTIGGSTLAWWLARRDKRDDRRHSASAPGAPTVQEIWIRQDKMERAFKSSIVLLGEVAEQTVDHHPPLILSRRHVAILSEGGYLPAEWDFMVDERG